MKRLFLFCFFLLTLCLLPSRAWADSNYSGGFTLSGTMGNDIQFAIHAAYWGDDPCAVVGETWYMRKNGKVAKIKLHGWLSDDACYLRETVEGKVCGMFVIEMPGPGEMDNFEECEGRTVTGNWTLGEKTYEFKDVKLSRESGYADEKSNIDYDQYLHYSNFDDRYLSGTYGFYDVASSPGDTLYATITVDVQEDSIYWTCSSMSELGGWDVNLSTPGVKNNGTVKTQEGSFCPKVDGREFEASFLDNIMLVTCTKDIEDEESDCWVDLSGVYPKRADRVKVYRKVSFDKKDPDAISYCEVDLSIPRTDNERLNDSIRVWVGRRLGIEHNSNRDMWKVAEEYAQSYVNSCEAPERDEEGHLLYYQLGFTTVNVAHGSLNNRNYINLNAFITEHTGGMHPFSFSISQTLRRSDGKAMGWKDWFVSPDNVRPIVEKYMREQNGDVEFDSEVLQLPDADPTFEAGLFSFEYGQYEAAPYCYGMPCCNIPLAVLMPYLTEGAKKLVK